MYHGYKGGTVFAVSAAIVVGGLYVATTLSASLQFSY
jgi:ATP-binding cassette subfamily B (MDR/TAP) protein 1